MKNFVKENWYKLMVGSSMLMASFGFMIYAISPVYSNSDKEKTEIKNTGIPNSSNGVIVGNNAYFVDKDLLPNDLKIFTPDEVFVDNINLEAKIKFFKIDKNKILKKIKNQNE